MHCVPYIDGDGVKAISKAYEIWRPMRDLFQRNEDPLYRRKIQTVIDEYFDIADRNTTANEALKAAGQPPTIEIKNGKGYWSNSHLKDIKIRRRKLQPFLDGLPTQSIADVTYSDLNTFMEWSIINHPEWSPSTRSIEQNHQLLTGGNDK